MTVPGLRHAKQLVEAIRERLGDGPQAAGDRQPLRAEDVLVRPAQGRHRAGARRVVRRLHPEPLRPGARSHRPRRSARRGQAGQQDHAAAQEADPAAAGREAGGAQPAAWSRSSSCPGRDSATGNDPQDHGSRNENGRSFHRSPRRCAGACAGAGGAAPALEGVVLDGASRRPSAEPSPRRRRQSAAHRQAARRQGPPASPADRGDQPVGAGEAAGRRDARAYPAARHAIHPGRAAGAQPAGAQRLRLRDPRRDDRAWAARAAAQGRDHQRHPDQRSRMRLCGARRPARALRRALQGRAHLLRIINKIVVGGRPARR